MKTLDHKKCNTFVNIYIVNVFICYHFLFFFDAEVCDIPWDVAVLSLLYAPSEVARLKAFTKPPSACIFSSSFLVSGSTLSISCTGGGGRWLVSAQFIIVMHTPDHKHYTFTFGKRNIVKALNPIIRNIGFFKRLENFNPSLLLKYSHSEWVCNWIG